MSHIANNPYPQEAPEHGLWERWRQLFYAQPLAEQLVELHAHLRGNLEHFQALSSEVSPAAVNERFHREVIDFEDSYGIRMISRRSLGPIRWATSETRCGP